MPLPAESAAVPTVADLETKWGLKKEALRSLSVTEKEGALSAAFDTVLAALGKRVKRPVSFIDDGLKELMCKLASANLLGWRRGFNPRQGQDEWILEELRRMTVQMEDIRTGKVEYYYVDSTAGIDEQGPYGGGDATADAYYRRGRCGCVGGCGQCYGLPGGH